MSTHSLPLSVHSLLDDPIVELLMASDRIDRDSVLDTLEDAFSRLFDNTSNSAVPLMGSAEGDGVGSDHQAVLAPQH